MVDCDKVNLNICSNYVAIIIVDMLLKLVILCTYNGSGLAVVFASWKLFFFMVHTYYKKIST